METGINKTDNNRLFSSMYIIGSTFLFKFGILIIVDVSCPSDMRNEYVARLR